MSAPQRPAEFYAHACLYAGLDAGTSEDAKTALRSLKKALAEDPGLKQVAR